MTPEEIETILEQHRYPTLRTDDTGINVLTLQVWLQALGDYHGATNGILDPSTAQAVEMFHSRQTADGADIPVPPSAVLGRATWLAMEQQLSRRLPPDPAALERNPLPRRSSFDSDLKYQKALYEGLRGFGFPVATAVEALRIPVAMDGAGRCVTHGLPPGEYTLEFDQIGPSSGGAVELQLVQPDGSAFAGHVRLYRTGEEHTVTVATGHLHLAGLAPGEYELAIDHADPAASITRDSGSLELSIANSENQPLGGTAYLVTDTGSPDSIKRAVSLFKALHRGLRAGVEPNDRTRLGNSLLSGTFDESAHEHHARAWDDFATTWGRFYGAPWHGILFHPTHGAPSSREELNWGTFQLIHTLHEWGATYLRAAENEQDLIERLSRPIALRYLSKPLGGQIQRRNDFSQTGHAASLHLQRTTSVIINGIDTRVMHGGITYTSPEYSTPHQTAQISSSLLMNTHHELTTADDSIVTSLLPREFTRASSILISDRRAASKSENASLTTQTAKISKYFPYYVYRRSTIESIIAALSGDAGHLIITIIIRAQQSILTRADIERIQRDISGVTATARLKPSHAKQILSRSMQQVHHMQKALHWCRLLVTNGHYEKARQWSTQYTQAGWAGLFTVFSAITPTDSTNNLQFAFNDEDWTNLLQLESCVEFHLLCNDPHRPAESYRHNESKDGSSEPRLPHITFDKDSTSKHDLSSGSHLILIDGFGSRNNANELNAPASLMASGDQHLVIQRRKGHTSLTINALTHSIHIPQDTKRASATYRVLTSEEISHTESSVVHKVTLDGAPSIHGDAACFIVLSNSWLSGDNATASENVITINSDTPLCESLFNTININYDTIQLQSDTVNPRKLYIISSVNILSQFRVELTINGTPILQGGISQWQIPGGIGGTPPPMPYKPYSSLGYRSPPTLHDHFDGVLFLVHEGVVIDRFRFSSHTSHAFLKNDPSSSSIRGNKKYRTSAFTAGHPIINFGFALYRGDISEADSSRQYRQEKVELLKFPGYPPGGTYGIFVHYTTSDGQAASFGCLTSPDYYLLRESLIKLHSTRMRQRGVPYSVITHLINHPRNYKAYARFWNNSINPTLWLLRPNERPLFDYSALQGL